MCINYLVRLSKSCFEEVNCLLVIACKVSPLKLCLQIGETLYTI